MGVSGIIWDFLGVLLKVVLGMFGRVSCQMSVACRRCRKCWDAYPSDEPPREPDVSTDDGRVVSISDVRGAKPDQQELTDDKMAELARKRLRDLTARRGACG